jgi:CheY-like chemotaxis protein
MAYLLIVDDDLDFAQAAGAFLRSEGHEVAIELDSEKTVDRIQERRPDAIILDVMFPEDDTAGFKVASAIRQTFGDLPVLLLTAAGQSIPMKVCNRGIDSTSLPVAEFMGKPIDFKSLSKTIARILATIPGGA